MGLLVNDSINQVNEQGKVTIVSIQFHDEITFFTLYITDTIPGSFPYSNQQSTASHFQNTKNSLFNTNFQLNNLKHL